MSFPPCSALALYGLTGLMSPRSVINVDFRGPLHHVEAGGECIDGPG